MKFIAYIYIYSFAVEIDALREQNAPKLYVYVFKRWKKSSFTQLSSNDFQHQHTHSTSYTFLFLKIDYSMHYQGYLDFKNRTYYSVTCRDRDLEESEEVVFIWQHNKDVSFFLPPSIFLNDIFPSREN